MEDRKLLIKALCGYQPYGVIVRVTDCSTRDHKLEAVIEDKGLQFHTAFYGWNSFWMKPYLRPMSSMTAEEEQEIQKINCQFKKGIEECYVGDSDDGFCSVSEMTDIIDYLNSHFFDYRGLIDKELAIAVDENNNPYKI